MAKVDGHYFLGHRPLAIGRQATHYIILLKVNRANGTIMRMKKPILFLENLSQKRLAKPKLVSYGGRYGLRPSYRDLIYSKIFTFCFCHTKHSLNKPEYGTCPGRGPKLGKIVLSIRDTRIFSA